MKGVNLGLIDIETDDLIADLAVAKHERQANVAEPDDSYRRRLTVESVDQFRVHLKRP